MTPTYETIKLDGTDRDEIEVSTFGDGDMLFEIEEFNGDRVTFLLKPDQLQRLSDFMAKHSVIAREDSRP